jgi:hypothetical protein
MTGPPRPAAPRRALRDNQPASGRPAPPAILVIPRSCRGHCPADRDRGLVIDAYVHLDLASAYSGALAPVNEGILFRAEAVLALLAAAALILPARGCAWRLTFLPGLVISASA